MMNVTELLVTGFDGDQPVYAIALAPHGATAVLTGSDGQGEVSVDSIAQHAADVFGLVRELLEALTLTSR